MKEQHTRRSGMAYWCTLSVVVFTSLLVLFQVVSLIASYFPVGSLLPVSHNYFVLLILLACAGFSLYLLRTSRETLRGPLPLALLAGLPLGVLLGWFADLPNYMVLVLLLGPLGPFIARQPFGNGSLPSDSATLNFWLSLLCLLLSLLFAALVAFFAARRTGRVRNGMWGALLMACLAVLISLFTLTLIVLIPELVAPTPGISQTTSRIYSLAQFQDLSSLMLLLIGGQAVQATIGGYLGAVLGQRFSHSNAAIETE